MHKLFKNTILLILLFSFLGCGSKRIPGTEILDTPENWAVLNVVEEYQKAMESKDKTRILNLVSKNYFEKSKINKNKQLDYNLLENLLVKQFENIEAVRLTIKVININIVENVAKVEYDFSLKYQIHLPTGSKWDSKEDTNQMTMTRENNKWKIIKGI